MDFVFCRQASNGASEADDDCCDGDLVLFPFHDFRVIRFEHERMAEWGEPRNLGGGMTEYATVQRVSHFPTRYQVEN